jgi:hypothetical protein
VRLAGERPVGAAQAVVGYHGDICLDGATITATG